jgi:hypothetical protein
MKPVLIAPSVIAADFGYLRADIARAEQGGADMLHVDIMDGHFVPNITFGPDIVKKIKSLTKLPLDVHLMITHPRKFITPFVEAGAANITFHIECETDITDRHQRNLELRLQSRPFGQTRDAPLRREGLPGADRPAADHDGRARIRRPEIHARHDAEGEGSRPPGAK